ncbi:MAG: class I SAM-dependent methyltransferase [Chloroflexota bacterium]
MLKGSASFYRTIVHAITDASDFPDPLALSQVLWRIYRRPERPPLWVGGGNLPWDDPAFSERMLREHLDQSHGAASRTAVERELQLDWFQSKLGLAAHSRVLDWTCGPGLYAVPLAERGCVVTGVDFGPASIAYARDLATAAGVADLCTFVESDVRDFEPVDGGYDVALFLYGQLAVFPPMRRRCYCGKRRRRYGRAAVWWWSCSIRTGWTRRTARGGSPTTQGCGANGRFCIWGSVSGTPPRRRLLNGSTRSIWQRPNCPKLYCVTRPMPQAR